MHGRAASLADSSRGGRGTLRVGQDGQQITIQFLATKDIAKTCPHYVAKSFKALGWQAANADRRGTILGSASPE